MKRTGYIMAAALFLGLLLAGITGYLMWHNGHDKYVRSEMVGVSGSDGGSGEGKPGETGPGGDLDGNQGSYGQGQD